MRSASNGLTPKHKDQRLIVHCVHNGGHAERQRRKGLCTMLLTDKADRSFTWFMIGCSLKMIPLKDTEKFLLLKF